MIKTGKKDIVMRKKDINGINGEKKDKIVQSLFPLKIIVVILFVFLRSTNFCGSENFYPFLPIRRKIFSRDEDARENFGISDKKIKIKNHQ